MKKAFASLIIIFLTANVCAQNTFPVSGNAGAGTLTPRLPLEVRNNISLSSSSTSSMFILDGFGMNQLNDYSHVRLIASSAAGSGFLKSRIDNYGGAFSWTRMSASGEVNLMVIDATNGRVGIGTTTPFTRLDLGEIKLGDITSFPAEGSVTDDYGSYVVGNINGGQKLRLGVANDGYTRAEIYLENNNTDVGAIYFKTSDGTPAATRMLIDRNGRVGIGTTNVGLGYKLFVEEGIRTRKVKVDMNNWPDYVFHPSYSLQPLSEVERYIKEHQHLPDVPSAKEVANNGLDLGENQAVLLKKIEELTLYAIELKKELEAVKTTVKKLQKQNGN